MAIRFRCGPGWRWKQPGRGVAPKGLKPVPRGVEGQRPGNEPVIATEVAAQPGDRAGSGAELFLCEGDSALGTIKAARDATFQAAFPLKGKPPNVYGYTVSKARAKDEFDSIERILGCGVRDNCDPESCRYDRILFASDADPDGGNINSSLISMFLDFYRPLIKAGMVLRHAAALFVVRTDRNESTARTSPSATPP